MFENQLRQAKLKITPARLKILHLLNKSKHLSAEDIYKLLLKDNEQIGIATIYRVLTQLEYTGLVAKHNFDNSNAIFELSGKSHHDHLMCLDCGKVVEFYNDIIEKCQDKVARDNGFTLSHHSLYLYGSCKECQNKE